MIVERIFIHPARSSRTEHERVQVVAGAGIEGDRNFGKHDEPGQNVTLVEAEEIESFLIESGRLQDSSLFGRNFVCRGVRLSELVGREFVIGEVRLRGVELCEPCRTLGRALASDTIDAPGVVKRLLHRAGLRADALSTGVVQVGDRIGGVALAAGNG
jgi:MOSC domain-containing protein YiiM